MNAQPRLETSPDAAISVRALSKTYGNGKQALSDITLDIPRGSVFALLGPNGAGKSTLINILAGLVNKTSGTASIWGVDIDVDRRNSKLAIGVVPQELVFDAFFTAFEVLELQAGLYGIPPAQRRTMDLLKAVKLDDKAHAYSRTLSGGMKRRLLIAKAMVHAPPVLILDEPTAGVDLELRQQLWSYVQELHDQGTTIVLTTHYLEEAQNLCDRIAIINHGRVIANATKENLLSQAVEKRIVITVNTEINTLPDGLAAFGAHLRDGRRIALTYDRHMAQIGDVFTLITQAGLGIDDVSTEEADLEDVFLSLTQIKNTQASPIKDPIA